MFFDGVLLNGYLLLAETAAADYAREYDKDHNDENNKKSGGCRSLFCYCGQTFRILRVARRSIHVTIVGVSIVGVISVVAKT